MSKIEPIKLALISPLEQHERDGMLPTSGQFLWYELIANVIVSKEKREPKPGNVYARQPKQDVIDALFDVRESGDIPWNWIADETRRAPLAQGQSRKASFQRFPMFSSPHGALKFRRSS
jgi:hypothetical protein